MELNYENNINKKIFVNILLKKGKKIISEKIIKNLLIQIKKKEKKNPNKILKKFIKKTSPKIKSIELPKKKRWTKKKNNKKKKLYLIIFLKKDRQKKIPIKWLLKNKNIIQEIIATSKNKGRIIKEKKKLLSRNR